MFIENFLPKLGLLICLSSSSAFSQIDSTEKKTLLLKEVVIQGKTDIGLNKSIKNDPDLQNSIDKMMREINGVTLIKRGNYALEPTIRGLNGGQINTLVDGMHIVGACTDRMDPVSSYIEPNNLNKISVSFGPDETQYGSSLGGGLNFSLRKAQPGLNKKFSSVFGQGFESNAKAIQTLGSIHISQRRWAILANSIYRKAGNYTDGNQKVIDFSYYEKLNYNLAGTILINDFHRIQLMYLQDNAKNIGYPALTMDVSFANAKLGSLNYIYHRSGKKFYHFETKLYGNFIDHAMDDTKRPVESVPMHMDMPGTSMTMGFYSRSSIKITERNFLKLNLNAYQNDLHAEMTMYPTNGAKMFMLTIPDTRRAVIGIGANDKQYFGEILEVKTGILIDYTLSDIITNVGRQTVTSFYTGTPKKTHLIFNSHVQIDYKTKKSVLIFIGLAQGMRAPTLQEQFGFYLFNRVDSHDYLGNPDLKKEKSLNVQTGFHFQKKEWHFSGQIFSYFFRDYIAGFRLEDYSVMTIGGSGVKEYRNIKSANLNGFEFAVNGQLYKNITFQSENSFTIATDFENEALPFIPPFKSRNSINYVLSGYQFSLEYSAASAQYNVSSSKYGELPSKGYNIFNFQINKRYSIKSLSIITGVSIENIFDTAYYDHLDVIKINRQGRNLILHLTFKF